MTTVENERRGSSFGTPRFAWENLEDRNTVECRVAIVPEEGGGFSAFAIRLPGAASQGDTVEEALDNIKDAFVEVLRYYLESGEPIPWCSDRNDLPGNYEERWVLVDV